MTTRQLLECGTRIGNLRGCQPPLRPDHTRSEQKDKILTLAGFFLAWRTRTPSNHTINRHATNQPTTPPHTQHSWPQKEPPVIVDMTILQQHDPSCADPPDTLRTTPPPQSAPHEGKTNFTLTGWLADQGHLKVIFSDGNSGLVARGTKCADPARTFCFHNHHDGNRERQTMNRTASANHTTTSAPLDMPRHRDLATIVGFRANCCFQYIFCDVFVIVTQFGPILDCCSSPICLTRKRCQKKVGPEHARGQIGGRLTGFPEKEKH